MNRKTMLHHLAQAHLNHGPHRKRQDAATLLSMLPSLDEQSARVYLHQFVQKWGLADSPEPVNEMPYVRRRPMSRMEQHVALQLIEPSEPEPVRVFEVVAPDAAAS